MAHRIPRRRAVADSWTQSPNDSAGSSHQARPCTGDAWLDALLERLEPAEILVGRGGARVVERLPAEPGADVDVEPNTGDLRSSGDAELYEMLRDIEFADQAFELLAVNLAAYGWGVLCAWLRSGTIFSKCAEQGRPVIPSDGERAVLYNEPDELHGLVNETLAEALVFLRAQAVSGEGKWDPTGDSLLTTYFVGACVLRFPTVHRRWSRLQQRTPPPAAVEVDVERPAPGSLEDAV